MATKKKRGLGRGLDALLGEEGKVLPGIDSLDDNLGEKINLLPLKSLKAGKYQPRSEMDEEALNELAGSIKTQGVMQPVLVRKADGKTIKYEIIAGERRFRAAKIAGLKEIPAIIKNVNDENAAVMALIENLQREDLNHLEEARGVKRLLDDFGLTHEEAAKAVGRSRSATSKILRLLNLCDPVQPRLLAGDIDMGYARALLALDAAGQIMLANEVVAKRLSVRETESRVTRYLKQQNSDATPKAEEDTSSNNGDIKRLVEKLSDYFGTRVSLKVSTKNRGNLQIEFHDWEHLNSLLEKQGLGNLLNNL